MKDIYRVTIHGRTLESRDLRTLLARAVLEKRSMDQKLRFLPPLYSLMFSGPGTLALGHRASEGASRVL